MRIFLLLFAISLVLFGDTRFSIEVLSVENRADINASFMDKVNETDLPFTTHHTGKVYKVLVGDFESVEVAKEVLPRVKKTVSEKAFITTGMAVIELDAKPKMIQAAIMAQAKALKKPQKVIKSEEIKAPQEEVNENKKDVVSKVYCKKSKKALREYEVSEALDFYKHSSFYSFKN